MAATDGQRGGQCSCYVANRVFGWTDGNRMWGPCNGKDMVDWLVRNKGWKYIDRPVDGSVFSTTGGTYGHTGFNENGGSRDSNFNLDEIVRFHAFRQGNKFAVPPNWSEPAPTPSGQRVAQNGTYVANMTMKIRWEPGLNGKYSGVNLQAGQSVRYDSYIDVDGIRWISYMGNSGNRCYIARRQLDNSIIYGECF